MGPSEDRSPVRRRGAELEHTLLDAAWDEFLDVGYAKLTMEGVAARARTGKQVLYRRWPNRLQLMLAALRHRVDPLFRDVPDTGSLREDVLTVLRLMIGRFREIPPDLTFGILAEFPDLTPEFFQIMTGVMMDILRAAVARGELAHADVTPRVATLAVDLLRYEGLKAGHALSGIPPQEAEALIVEIVDDVYLPLIRTVVGAGANGP